MIIRGLYAITDPQLTPDLVAASETALAAGVKWLQYRNKAADPTTRFKEGRELVALCRQYGARLIVNDEPVLAHAIKADGVHLGQKDGDVAEAREFLGADSIIGVSCHGSAEQAQQAKAAGADYVAFGRFFASKTKPQAEQASIDVLQQTADLGISRVAIGGITPDLASPLLNAGADALAVIHGVFGQDDITAACHAFIRLFEE